jgi:hypothetical protein
MMDNLLKKNWPCEPECPLCYCINETYEHLLTECNFTEVVWDKIVQDLPIHHSLIPFNKGRISDWIQAAGQAGSKQRQRVSAGIIFLFWWLIWKERKVRVFELQESSFIQVVERIKAAAREFNQAVAPF